MAEADVNDGTGIKQSLFVDELALEGKSVSWSLSTDMLGGLDGG